MLYILFARNKNIHLKEGVDFDVGGRQREDGLNAGGVGGEEFAEDMEVVVGLQLDQHLKLVWVQIPGIMWMKLREDIGAKGRPLLIRRGGHPG